MNRYALSSFTSWKTRNKPAVEIRMASLAVKGLLIPLCCTIEGCAKSQTVDGFAFSRIV